MKIPTEIVFLGLALEISVTEDDTAIPRRVRIDLKGTSPKERQRAASDRRCWLMATDAASMNAKPGEARLYLLRAPFFRDQVELPDHEPTDDTIAAFEQWAQRSPDKIYHLDIPDDIDEYYGQITAIVYASDKKEKRGKIFEYEHDFYENSGEPPDIFFDAHNPDDATAAVICGGTMSIDERGIV